MKLLEITFKHPVKIIQVFRHVRYYDKSEKSFDGRKDEMSWKAIPSKNGYVLDGALYLPEKLLTNPKFHQCDLITIEDENGPKSIDSTYQPRGYTTDYIRYTKKEGFNTEPDYNRCFHLHHPNKLDIFELREKDELELFLNYGYFEVGIPERENFMLCTLRNNSPVEIKINGKIDFSLTSRRARAFKEQQYVFDYLGAFSKCRVLKEPYEPVVKRVPADRKVVDLLKPLW